MYVTESNISGINIYVIYCWIDKFLMLICSTIKIDCQVTKGVLMHHRTAVPISILIFSLLIILSCSESDNITNPNQVQGLSINQNGFIESVSFIEGSSLEPGRDSRPSQLARTGCDFYPFVDPAYSWPHEYLDLQFMEFPGYEVSLSYVQMESSSTLTWYPMMIALPDPAESITWDLLDNENWEEWYVGSGYYRAIGCTVYLFDDQMQLLDEYETEANSDWQTYTFSAPGTRYIGIVGKYSEDVTNPYAASYVRFNNVTICYAPPCSVPEVSLEASQSIIWPPNHHVISVNFSGSITNNCGDATYELLDEYNELNYSGTLEPGDYSLDLDLIASRLGNDQDGRTYTFTISAGNDVGSDSESLNVVVLHDKGKKKK